MSLDTVQVTFDYHLIFTVSGFWHFGLDYTGPNSRGRGWAYLSIHWSIICRGGKLKFCLWCSLFLLNSELSHICIVVSMLLIWSLVSLHDQMPEARLKKIRLGVWHVPYLCRDVQGLLLAAAWNTEYKAPFSFTPHAINRLLSFCWWKPILNILGLPSRFETRPSGQQAGVLTIRQHNCLN